MIQKKHLELFYSDVICQDKKIMQIVFPLGVIFKRLEKYEYSLLAKYDLTHTQLQVLMILLFNYEKEGNYQMSPTQLYEAMVFSSGGMTKILKKLEEKQYISRVSSDTDKRNKLVKLELKGLSEIQTIRTLLINTFNDFFDVLDDDEQEVLGKIYKKLVFSFFDSDDKIDC